jgi:hypothetical protein
MVAAYAIPRRVQRRVDRSLVLTFTAAIARSLESCSASRRCCLSPDLSATALEAARELHQPLRALRRGLVAAEVALAVALVAGAGLLPDRQQPVAWTRRIVSSPSRSSSSAREVSDHSARRPSIAG